MLDNYKIILASGSPRRRELLAMLGLKFEIAHGIEVDETYPEDLDASMVALYLAGLKADAYHKIIKEGELYITADTTVVLDGYVLGKPVDAGDAFRMLRSLSGRTHDVITGVSMFTVERRIDFAEVTEVEFDELTDDEIRAYIRDCRPFDKAGAYGIQERIGAIGVKSIKGSFYNVMGLPIHQLYKTLDFFVD